MTTIPEETNKETSDVEDDIPLARRQEQLAKGSGKGGNGKGGKGKGGKGRPPSRNKNIEGQEEVSKREIRTRSRNASPAASPKHPGPR